MANYLPEAGEETPMMRAGGTDVTVEDMVEAFGAYTVYYESKERRPSKGRQTDAPGRKGIYVGRSKLISGGHRIIPIEWNQETHMWTLGAYMRICGPVPNSWKRGPRGLDQDLGDWKRGRGGMKQGSRGLETRT